MVEWKVEEMKFRKYGFSDLEISTNREDKIEFVDRFCDGKFSYLLSLIERFKDDYDTLPHDNFGYVKTVSLMAWIKRNDVKYDRPIIDDWYKYGEFNVAGVRGNINRTKEDYELIRYGNRNQYTDIVDFAFRNTLEKCLKEEERYFRNTDEYCILKQKFRQRHYNTTFGVPITELNDGNIYISKEDDYHVMREITIDELRLLLSKYEELDALVSKIEDKINIEY